MSFDLLTVFGLTAVLLMVLFYELEDRHPRYVFLFALACVLGGLYGVLQGAWPFGIAELIFSLSALRRWWRATTTRH